MYWRSSASLQSSTHPWSVGRASLTAFGVHVLLLRANDLGVRAKNLRKTFNRSPCQSPGRPAGSLALSGPTWPLRRCTALAASLAMWARIAAWLLHLATHDILEIIPNTASIGSAESKNGANCLDARNSRYRSRPSQFSRWVHWRSAAVQFTLVDRWTYAVGVSRTPRQELAASAICLAREQQCIRGLPRRGD